LGNTASYLVQNLQIFALRLCIVTSIPVQTPSLATVLSESYIRPGGAYLTPSIWKSHRLCVSRSKLRKHGIHLLHLDRLYQEHVHATCERCFLRRRVSKACDSHDHSSRASTCILEATNCPRGFEAIHNRHVYIHQHDFWLDGSLGLIVADIVGALLFCGIFVNVDGFLTVLCCTIGMSAFLGKDFEKAQIDSLLNLSIGPRLKSFVKVLTLSSTNKRENVFVLTHGAVYARLICSLIRREAAIDFSDVSLPLR